MNFFVSISTSVLDELWLSDSLSFLFILCFDDLDDDCEDEDDDDLDLDEEDDDLLDSDDNIESSIKSG